MNHLSFASGRHSRPAAPYGVILIGPGRHFGIELIRRFAAEGCRVGVMSSRQEAVHELAGSLADLSGQIIYACADIAETKDYERQLTNLAAQLGHVDCLIYNPKHSVKASGLATHPDDLHQAMTVNVTGAMVAIQALLPYLQRRHGRVILTGGGYKDRPDAEKFALSVGKAGMHGLFRALKDPLHRRGVEVKTIVIDGAVRRSGMVGACAHSLADFYWSVFAERGGNVHRFPGRRSDEDQLKLFA
jgi:NAD(P)-dependent dehydrogenase (short-subunit alcohol dehydrogenase family)